MGYRIQQEGAWARRLRTNITVATLQAGRANCAARRANDYPHMHTHQFLLSSETVQQIFPASTLQRARLGKHVTRKPFNKPS